MDETTRDSSGDITESGELGAFALNVGDCVNDPSMLGQGTEPGTVGSFTGVPCAETHTGEVILVASDFFADETAMPTEQEMFQSGGQRCVEALDEYTGTSYTDSNYDVSVLYPTQESWDLMDDRELVCIGVVLSETGTPVESVGSIKAGS